MYLKNNVNQQKHSKKQQTKSFNKIKYVLLLKEKKYIYDPTNLPTRTTCPPQRD